MSYGLGQVSGRPLLANYTALQSAIVAFESNRLTRAVVQASTSIPANVIVKAFSDAKAKAASPQPREMSEVDFYALLLGTLTQARTDLVRAKLFMYSPAAGDTAARSKFEAVLAGDMQMLQQVSGILNSMIAEGSLPTLTRLVGGTSGLGFVMIAVRTLQLVWSGIRAWRAAQLRREQFLRQQIELCEELSRRGSPCAPQRVAELRAELQQMTDSPAARFLEDVGEGLRNVTSPFDSVGQGIGRGLKIGITTISVGVGLVALWWAWPILTATRRRSE